MVIIESVLMPLFYGALALAVGEAVLGYLVARAMRGRG